MSRPWTYVADYHVPIVLCPEWWMVPYGDRSACWGCGLEPDQRHQDIIDHIERFTCAYCRDLLPWPADGEPLVVDSP